MEVFLFLERVPVALVVLLVVLAVLSLVIGLNAALKWLLRMSDRLWFPKLFKCVCQKCDAEVDVVPHRMGQCPNCQNVYTWDHDILWWNEGGTGIRFDLGTGKVLAIGRLR